MRRDPSGRRRPMSPGRKLQAAATQGKVREGLSGIDGITRAGIAPADGSGVHAVGTLVAHNGVRDLAVADGEGRALAAAVAEGT